MKSVKTANTRPEIAVRKELFALGYRFRLHRKDLPGSPDIVFPTRKKAIFVNGCFWHGHGCAKGQAPKSRLEYWGPKIETTKERDERNLRELAGLGWQAYVIWTCELKDIQSLRSRLRNFLGSPGSSIGKDVKRRSPEGIIE